MRTFDDFTIGEELEFGEAAFELDEMIAFAERWDPQLFHTDSQPPPRPRSDGIIASGWQTLAAVGRRLTDRIVAEQWANLGGTGMNGIRLLAPVDTPAMCSRFAGRLLPSSRRRAGSLEGGSTFASTSRTKRANTLAR